MSSQNIITPESLIQTQNGEKFYAYSGIKTVTSSGIDMINIANIGERDIELFLELSNAANLGTDNPVLIVYANEEIIFQEITNNTYMQYPQGYNELRLIIPANTSLRVHMTINANSYDYCVGLTGNYLSME